MFPKFHWTVNVQGAVGMAFSLGWLAYNSAHDKDTYQRWLLKRSPLEISDDLAQRLETQLQNVSDRRLRPYKEARYSACIIDELESDTLGSMVHIRAGSLFKLSSRLEINQADDIKKYFPNLAAMENRLRGHSINTANVADNLLRKTILTEEAKNFALTREILRADSGAETLVPFTSSLVCYFGSLPILQYLRPLVGSVGSVVFVIGLSTTIFVGFFKSFREFSALNFDKKVYSIDDTYAAGCEQYLKASIELGKILHEHGGEEIRRLVEENGDCLFHVKKYSERLAMLESYIRKKQKLSEKK